MPSVSLTQSQALTELASHLYDFLPGKPHPYADQAISFQGVAASLGLQSYWTTGSKEPAIAQLLSQVLEHRSKQFSPLIVEIVKRGMAYRQNKGKPIMRGELDTVNHDSLVKTPRPPGAMGG